MFGMGIQELLLVMIIALALFGAKRLPEVGRGVGRSIAAFKEGLRADAPSREGGDIR